MQKLTIILFLFFNYTGFAQTILTDSSLLIKPGFNKGDVKTYLVNEIATIESSPLFPVKSENDFKITFHVLDTTNGYTIQYKSELVRSTNKRYIRESLKAQLINGINLIYRLNKDGWVIELPNYMSEKERVIKKLDSILNKEELKKDDQAIAAKIRNVLEKDNGLEICLGPLLLFNDIYTKPIFRYRQDYHPMSTMNIFYRSQIPGTAILELLRKKDQTNSSTVTIDFTANRDSAAKYMTPSYQEAYMAIKGKPMKSSITEMKISYNRKYEVEHPSGTLIEISDKHVEFYLARTVRKTIMKLINE